jgi:CBS domain-containing protein
MADANLGAVVVLAGRRLAGIFSERDFARKVTLHKKTPQTTPIKEVMTTEVFAVRAETSADECLSLMTRKGVRHLPVTRGDEVVGFVSILEVVGTVLAERETMISNLERYVSETWPL